MSTCSRCGANDDRHSVKCYQAMAVGWAMGVEKRPDAAASSTLTPYGQDRKDFGADVAKLRQTIREQTETIRILESGRDTWRNACHQARDELAMLRDSDVGAPDVTYGVRSTLPPDYYDRPRYTEDHVPPERLAEIEREVEALNANPNLHVVIHDELNATVHPLPVDQTLDTDESYPDHGPADDAAAAVGLPSITAGTLPEPVVDDTDWSALVRSVRAERGWTQKELATELATARSLISFWEQGQYKPSPDHQAKLRQLAAPTPPAPAVETPPTPEAPSPAAPAPEAPAAVEVTPSGKLRPEPGKTWMESNAAKIGVPGAWAQPETLAAEAAAQEFIDQCLEPTPETREARRWDEKGRSWGSGYVTAPELVDAYEKWAKANDKPITKASPRMVGAAATKSPLVKYKKQGPAHGGGKPNCYFGVKLILAEPQAAVPAPAPKPVDPTEQIRKIMAAARTVKTETIPEPEVEVPHGPDELAIKLAQLKRFGIGGEHGVSRPAAQAAVADLHPTGRDIWKWSPPESTNGTADADLDATAYQLLVKCMNGLPEEYGFDYKEDVLATAGFQAEDVEAALRRPHRVEIRPESWDKEKRYPILGFHRGDVSVILGMLTPAKPRVIAAYWTSLLGADTHRVTKTGGGGSKGSAGLPTSPGVAMSRLRDRGCEIPEPVDEKPVEVTYKGQSLGKIMTARTTTKITVQADYQRTLRKMQAIDRRVEAKVG